MTYTGIWLPSGGKAVFRFSPGGGGVYGLTLTDEDNLFNTFHLF